MMRRRAVLLSLSLAFLHAVPALAQAPQFRADVARDGDEPFDGTMYFGNQRMRIEGTSDGEEFTAIINAQANSVMVLMPADRIYMTMDLGAAPFSAPSASAMDPGNPCSSGELTECRALGTETINGRAARGWEYTRDGERETAWIANDLNFPVRTVEADGTTTDFTNVQMGPQPSALFEPPAGYTAMDMSVMMGRGRGAVPPGALGGRGQVPTGAARGQAPPTGRGQAAGRGAVPPGGRGQAAGRGAPPAAAGGVDPAQAAQLTAQLQALGLPPDQIAAALAGLGAAAAVQGIDYSAWEAGDGWIVDMVANATYSGTLPCNGCTVTTRFTASFTGSVPINYGTPGTSGIGPAWQLVPGLGSPVAEAQRVTFAGTSEYRVETVFPQQCPDQEGTRRVSISRATGSTDATLDTGGAARWDIAPDLSTHRLSAGAGAVDATETTEITTTITGRCPMSESQNETEQSTRVPRMSIAVNFADLPLPASPGVMSGTATVDMEYDLRGGDTNTPIPTTVEWTLRPIR